MTRTEEWDVPRLIRWAAKQCDHSCHRIMDLLSCEGLPQEKIPPGAWPAVRTYRHMNSKARLTRIFSVLKKMEQA